MSIENDLINISKDKAFEKEGFKSLFGLTIEVEKEIILSIEKGKKKRLISLFQLLHPADQADMLERLSKNNLNLCLNLLGKKLELETLVFLDDEVKNEVIKIIGTSALIRALPELKTDDAVEILEELNESDRSIVIKKLPKTERMLVEEAFSFPEHSAGRLMQRDFLSFPEYWTVGQTIDHMRTTFYEEEKNFYSVFITDPAQRLLGELSLAKLLSNNRSTRLKDIMQFEFKSVNVNTDQEEVSLLFQQYGLVNIPVVDDEKRVLGVIIVDDIVDVITEEAEEDIFGLGGVRHGSIRASIFETMKGRFSWLIINLITAIIASSVISLFQNEIEKIVALAVLMPIVASMGGNAGTQTVTVAVRAIATRQLNYVNLQKFVLRETWVGMLNGILFAFLSSLLAFIWFNDIQIALIMGVAMITNLLIAGILGTLIPLTLEKYKIDPAISSSVFLTTVTDVIGFFTFLGLAAWVIL
tara:strand:+ start:1347 stop:2759 length:1413 start_codon:yes stop_codon:yes gene_type:complete